jgi:CRP/FNR family transcriptional regulator, cyclic AMP receptor protein
MRRRCLSTEETAMTSQLLPVLLKHPFVAEFKAEHSARLAELAQPVHFDAGQIIFHEGDDYSVFYLLGEGMVSLEIEAPGQVLRVQTLYAGDELDWSAVLPHAGKHFQARALTPVTALAFEGEQLLASFEADAAFGLAFMLRLMGVVSERLRATRVQLLDMYAPEARRAGT